MTRAFAIGKGIPPPGIDPSAIPRKKTRKRGQHTAPRFWGSSGRPRILQARTTHDSSQKGCVGFGRKGATCRRIQCSANHPPPPHPKAARCAAATRVRFRRADRLGRDSRVTSGDFGSDMASKRAPRRCVGPRARSRACSISFRSAQPKSRDMSRAGGRTMVATQGQGDIAAALAGHGWFAPPTACPLSPAFWRRRSGSSGLERSRKPASRLGPGHRRGTPPRDRPRPWPARFAIIRGSTFR